MINEELWDFPHAMTLKVMGAAEAPLEKVVSAILSEHLGNFDADKQLTQSFSSSGKFVSLSAKVVMENRQQVEAIYAALNKAPEVKVVL